MKISVIIPTLNEADWIGRTLQSVCEQPGSKELIVVDGGSSDRTVERATGRARVIRSARGRAIQMNRGAAEAVGDVLFFLHADTLLPADAFSTVRKLLAAPSIEAGTFRLQFDRQTPLLNFYGFCTRIPLPSLCFGDRGLFVRRQVFEELNGYPEIPIFEDLEIVRRLHRRGGFHFCSRSVTTAARRFVQKGLLRQQLQNTCLWLYYMLGGNPHTVAHLYSYRRIED